MDFRQIFVIGAFMDKDKQLVMFWVKHQKIKVTLSRWSGPALDAAVEFTAAFYNNHIV